MNASAHSVATVTTILGTVLNAIGQVIGLIPDVTLAKCATVIGMIAMIYLIQLHRKNIAKIEIETKLAQLKYDQQMRGRREGDLE